MTHTSTPWIENEQLRHDGTAAGTGYDIWTNSEQAHYVGSVTRREDAKLIAAAPEMLETLLLVLDRATMPGFLRDRVKDAINAAKGKH